MKYLVIDVREQDEFNAGHLNGAMNLPLGLVIRGATELADVPKDTELLLYCRSGGRAGVALEALAKQGFTNVTNGINQDTLKSKYKLK